MSSESKSIQPVLEYEAPPTAATQPGEDPFEIFMRLHRLLRGRYIIAVSLATVLAMVGAIGGWKATVPKYTSVGMIRIKTNQPFKVYQLDKEVPIQINSFAKSQANLLQDPRVIDRAMDSPEWKQRRSDTGPDAKDEFRESLQVSVRAEDPEWIYVRFTDSEPEVAKLAVGKVIQSYITIHGDKELIVTPQLIDELVTKMTTKQTAITLAQGQIQDLLKNLKTTEIDSTYKAALTRLEEIDRSLGPIKVRLEQADAAEAAAKSNTAAPSVAPEADPEAVAAKIASVDDTMKAMLSGRLSARARLDALRSQGYGAAHRSVQQAEAGVSAAQRQVEEYAKEFMDRNPGFGLDDAEANATPMKPESKAALLKQKESLEKERKEVADRAEELDKQGRTIASLREQIKKDQSQLADIERRHTMLTTESGSKDLENRVQIISEGELPNRPSIDSRRKLAAFGFLLGAGLPFGGCLLWGLLDRRYRYSDDATHGRLRPALLGILPYLPDNMNDPEQAAIAAHCVHQIRTMLQISAAHEDRRVFAVTSPTSGDGKTSLTLSLALSFASSGCNTCMIDFDMIGGGLTSSLDAKTDKGLFDAIDGGVLNGHVQPTSFKRLSLVPVGRDDAHQIARLSPEVVGRIIMQAREQFDVVIIDTGPILGSIEAPLVSSAADGVILTIGHGQGRTQADLAMESLTRVGAKLLGVVFNRAQPGDFRRAVSSASVRSVPNQAGRQPVRTLPALGPMANTVASQSTMSPEEAPPHER